MKTYSEPNANLDRYLEECSAVDDYHLEETGTKKDPINIMMGQTFDDGQPLDLVKYSLIMAGVSDVLGKNDIEARATWLIADHFISDINQDQGREIVIRQAEERINYLSKLNNIYGINIGFVSSAELSQTPLYQQNLDMLSREANKNPDFMRAVLLAVPEDRRDDQSAVQYPLEEIATIESMNTDIKVGPVYEIKYDLPSRNIASKIGFKVFSSIYGTRGYLFGNPDLSPDLEESVEEFGILPYKINSKGLRANRVDPVNSDADDIERLLSETADIRAIQDMIAIASLAKEKLDGKPIKDKDVTRLDIQQAKKIAFNAYLCYIYSPLN